MFLLSKCTCIDYVFLYIPDKSCYWYVVVIIQACFFGDIIMNIDLNIWHSCKTTCFISAACTEETKVPCSSPVGVMYSKKAVYGATSML